MKHLIIAVLIVLCTVSFGFGREWRPFVGIGVGGDINCPLSQLDLPNYAGGLIPNFAYAATIRAGTVCDAWSLYAGYHFQDAMPVTIEDGWYRYQDGYYSQIRDFNWKVSWVELGGRWTSRSTLPRRVAPIIGGALVISDTKLFEQTTYQSWEYGREIEDYYSSTSTRRSTTDLGFLLEFGFRVHVSKDLSLDMISRLHRYEAEFKPSPQEPYLDHFVTAIPMLEIGANWQLPFTIR